jgi:hypothetical protein
LYFTPTNGKQKATKHRDSHRIYEQSIRRLRTKLPCVGSINGPRSELRANSWMRQQNTQRSPVQVCHYRETRRLKITVVTLPLLRKLTTAQEQCITRTERLPVVPVNPRKRESSLASFVTRPASTVRQKMLDDQLLKMIVRDFQPFSVVEEAGVRTLVAALDTPYVIPSRQVLTQICCRLKSQAVEHAKTVLTAAEAKSITTDSGKTICTQNCFAVTGTCNRAYSTVFSAASDIPLTTCEMIRFESSRE